MSRRKARKNKSNGARRLHHGSMKRGRGMSITDGDSKVSGGRLQQRVFLDMGAVQSNERSGGDCG